MSEETRTQKRDRIEHVYDENMTGATWRQAHRQGLEIVHAAGAAEALAGLYRAAGTLPLDLDTVTVQEAITRFTQERGIDLEPEDLPALVTKPCRSCGAPIVWATSASGKPIPMDPEPIEEAGPGLFRVEEGARAVSARSLSISQGPFYKSHFSSCPHASQHRSR